MGGVKIVRGLLTESLFELAPNRMIKALSSSDYQASDIQIEEPTTIHSGTTFLKKELGMHALRSMLFLAASLLTTLAAHAADNGTPVDQSKYKNRPLLADFTALIARTTREASIRSRATSIATPLGPDLRSIAGLS